MLVSEFLPSLVNALQLSISSEIVNHGYDFDHDWLELRFASKPREKSWEYFESLMPGTWNWKRGQSSWTYRIGELEPVDPGYINLVTQFLLLTRLNKENMLKLAELDSRYRVLIGKIPDLRASNRAMEMESLDQISEFIFSELQRRGMTIRQLSEKSGLSQVALSQFKAGGDLKLSSLLKIARALDWKLRLG